MSRVQGPVFAVSLYDADRPGLLGRTTAAAQVIEGAGWPTYVSAADGTDEEVVVLELAVGGRGLGPVEDTPGWADLGDVLGRALDEVDPLLAVAGPHPVLDLDDPCWRVDQLTFCSGRADVARLDLDRRRAFNDLAGDGLVEVRDGAVRWATPPGVPMGVGLLRCRPLALAAATHEAWTGESVDLTPVLPEGDPAQQLWFWSPEGPGSLVSGVTEALPGHDVVVEDQLGPYAVVAAVARGPRSWDQGLADLRRAVVAVPAAWAGLLPRGGVAPPGLDPSQPATGVVDHLWLASDWAGELVGQVAEALDGCAPEQVGRGVLFATGPEARTSPTGPFPWTPLERWARMVRAAAVLGSRVRSDVAGPDVWF